MDFETLKTSSSNFDKLTGWKQNLKPEDSQKQKQIPRRQILED